MQQLPETLKNKKLTTQQLKEWGFTSDQQNHWTRALYIPHGGTLVKLVPEITLDENKLISLTIANPEDLKTLPDYKITMLLNHILDNLR